MMIKVRPEGLKHVTKNIDKDREELEHEIKYWLSKIDELKDVWQGEDADIFYESCTSYVKRMSSITDFYNTMGGFINDSGNKYNENDESLKRSLDSSKVIVDKKLKNLKNKSSKSNWR